MVNEWSNNECSECRILPLNISNSVTPSHPAKGGNGSCNCRKDCNSVLWPLNRPFKRCVCVCDFFRQLWKVGLKS